MSDPWDEEAERRRRNVGPDFSKLQLGQAEKGYSFLPGGFSIAIGWPEFLGFLAFWLGVLIGRDDRWLFGLFCFFVVWAPLRILISGSQALMGWFVGRKNEEAPTITEAGAAAPQVPKPISLMGWAARGAIVGAILGAGLAKLLGDDIAMWEGVVRLAPIGAIVGLAVGAFRARRKA